MAPVEEIYTEPVAIADDTDYEEFVASEHDYAEILDVLTTDTTEENFHDQRMKLADELNKELRIQSGCDVMLQVLSKRKRGGTIKRLKRALSLQKLPIEERVEEVKTVKEFAMSRANAIKSELETMTGLVHQTIPRRSGNIDLGPAADLTRHSISGRRVTAAPDNEGVPLLAVSRKCTGEVDLKGLLLNVLGQSAAEQLEKLQAGRQVTRQPTLADHDLDTIIEYYQMTVHLESRFARGEFPVYFTWYDNFTNEAITSNSLDMEKSSCLFNAAALLVQRAVSTDKTENKGLEDAAEFFRMAAGVYRHMQNIVPLEAISPDTGVNMLFFLMTLCLAQAEECRLQVTNKDFDLSRGFARVANDYRELDRQAKRLKAVPKPWRALIALKPDYYQALAEYNWAVSNESYMNLCTVYEVNVTGRYLQAQTLLRKVIQSCMPSYFEGFQATVKSNLSIVESRLCTLNTDIVNENLHIFVEMRPLDAADSFEPRFVPDCPLLKTHISDPFPDAKPAKTNSLAFPDESPYAHLNIQVPATPAGPADVLLGNFYDALQRTSPCTKGLCRGPLRPSFARKQLSLTGISSMERIRPFPDSAPSSPNLKKKPFGASTTEDVKPWAMPLDLDVNRQNPLFQDDASDFGY